MKHADTNANTNMNMNMNMNMKREAKGKRILRSFSCLMILAMLLISAACGKKTPSGASVENSGRSSSVEDSSNLSKGRIEITSVKLSKGSVSLKVGESETLTYSVTPENANDPELLWKTENEEIAVVDNGKITAMKEGETTVRLYSADGRFTVSCTVRVTAGDPSKTSEVRWELPFTVLKVGEKQTLKALVLPKSEENEVLAYRVGDSTVASVSENGELSALKAGLTDVTVTWGEKSDQCTVLVLEKDGKLPAAAKKSISAKVNDFLMFTDDQPLYKKAEGLTYVSSDATVVSAKDGKLTALKAGKATVTVKMGEQTVFEYSYTVTGGSGQNVKVTGVKVSKKEIEIEVGGTYRLSAEVLPAGATEKTVWWISENTKIAKISSDGTVTGLSEGSCYVTACTKDGEFTAVCRVYVREKGSDPTLVEVTGVEVQTKQITVKVGETFKLKYKVLPENATNKNVYFVSETKDILSVDKEGNVKALKTGKGMITVGTSGTDFTATCYVTVVEQSSESSNVRAAFDTTVCGWAKDEVLDFFQVSHLRKLNGKAPK